MTQYYIERKPLLNKTSLTSKEQARLDKLQELIAPLASKRGLVNYWERAAFNAVIQGTGADILKMNGNRMARICMERGWELSASIHDELKIAVPDEDVTPGTIELVRDVMTNRLIVSSIYSALFVVFGCKSTADFLTESSLLTPN